MEFLNLILKIKSSEILEKKKKVKKNSKFSFLLSNIVNIQFLLFSINYILISYHFIVFIKKHKLLKFLIVNVHIII